MCNIVIFGPAGVGKTTLIGYLALASYSDVDFDRYAQKIKRIIIDELGIEFNKEMILPSCISMDRDELQSYQEKNNMIGTTKRIHRSRISLPVSNPSLTQNKCIFIDTPGTHARIAEKYRGIFEGDLGIYIINCSEIIDLIDLEQRNVIYDQKKLEGLLCKYLEPLRFWHVYKSHSPLIIILSKIDANNVGFKEEIIQKAVFRVQEMLISANFGEREIQIIPTSILVDEDKKGKTFRRTAHNIVTSFLGFPCFIDVLSETVVPSIPEQRHRSEAGFAYIDMIARVKRDFHKKAFRVKILEGTIKNNDSVILGPIKYKGNTCFINSNVKSLKREKLDVCGELCEGQIGGIVLSPQSTIIEGSRNESFNADAVQLLKTSMITTGEIRKGNCIKIEIKRDELDSTEWRAIQYLYPKESIAVFWLGKRIYLDLVGRIIEDDRAFLYLLPLTKMYEDSIGCFALPKKIEYDLDLTIVLQLKADEYSKPQRKQTQEFERRYVHSQLIALYDYLQKKLSIDIEVYNKDCTNLFDQTEINFSYSYDDDKEATIIKMNDLTSEEIAIQLKNVRFLLRKKGIYNML
jgi:translation elongation factor EF-1alpha